MKRRLVLLGPFGHEPRPERERLHPRRLEPESGETLLNLAKLYVQQGRPEAARETFQRALRAPGERGDVYYNLATLDSAQGRAEEALRNLELAFRAGFRDVADLPRNRALDPLRTLPAYRRLMQVYLSR